MTTSGRGGQVGQFFSPVTDASLAKEGWGEEGKEKEEESEGGEKSNLPLH